MFEDKKWSDILKKSATEFLTKRYLHKLEVTVNALAELIEKAIEEGRQEVLDDPKKFELGNCEDCDERRSDEPMRDESRD
jgi:hypothetical protein